MSPRLSAVGPHAAQSAPTDAPREGGDTTPALTVRTSTPVQVRKDRLLPAWRAAADLVRQLVAGVAQQRRGLYARWAPRLDVSPQNASRYGSETDPHDATVADIFVMPAEDAAAFFSAALAVVAPRPTPPAPRSTGDHLLDLTEQLGDVVHEHRAASLDGIVTDDERASVAEKLRALIAKAKAALHDVEADSTK
jgi:hypothetical protein